MILRARVILPLSRAPIPDGAILIIGGRIAWIGAWRDLSGTDSGPVTDLGEVIVLPGLVNAHCHLDYTNMAGQFPPPKVFIDWLKLITATKAGWGYSDYAESWANGARMLLRNGATTVADIEAVPELLPEVWTTTPLRVFSFLEMIGITGRRSPNDIVKDAVLRSESLATGRCRTGLSPHAPYSTVPQLLQLSVEAARRNGWRISIHVAESALEFEMFASAKGAMFDWLLKSTRDMSDCGLGSPVCHLERHGLLNDHLLAAHVNYLARNDASILAQRRVHVVHCPRSHTYFNHDSFPLRRLQRAGVNICLGTDSLASVCKSRSQVVELNMFEEMRVLAKHEKNLSAKTILQMATLNGASALGLSGQVGELSERAFADLIAIPFKGKTADSYEAVLHHPAEVAASMIEGRWKLAPAQASKT